MYGVVEVPFSHAVLFAIHLADVGFVLQLVLMLSRTASVMVDSAYKVALAVRKRTFTHFVVHGA